jgi:hypothetical protein
MNPESLETINEIKTNKTVSDISGIDSERLKRIQKESIFLAEKYPEHTLIILHTKHKNTVKLQKMKYLINNSIKLDDFLTTLITKLQIDKNHVLYFKINNKVVNDTSKTIKEIYDLHTGNEMDSDDKKNYLIVEICRYTRYIRKAISLLTLNWL